MGNQLISSLDGNAKHPNYLYMKGSNGNDNENDMIHKELKITLSELEGSKEKLNCCLVENQKHRSLARVFLLFRFNVMKWPSHNNIEDRNSQSDNVLGVSVLIRPTDHDRLWVFWWDF